MEGYAKFNSKDENINAYTNTIASLMKKNLTSKAVTQISLLY